MEANKIIIKPLLTEKSYAGIANKVYAFVVDKKATKVDIKNAVEVLFGVKVKSVNTAIVKGHKKFQNTKAGRTEGKTSDYKKAIVTLTAESKTIAFFDSLS